MSSDYAMMSPLYPVVPSVRGAKRKSPPVDDDILVELYFSDMRHIFDETSLRLTEILRYGCPSHGEIITYPNYIVGHDRHSRNPLWTLECLHDLPPKKSSTGETIEFRVDDRVAFSSSDSDFNGSGFTRGHLAAAGNYTSRERYFTYTFTNIAPQLAQFNNGIWLELEEYIRKLARKHKVWVLTGVLYTDGVMRTIGINQVWIPSHYFKVLLIELKNGSLEHKAYRLPHRPTHRKVSFKHFKVPIDKIEQKTGYTIFPLFNSTDTCCKLFC